MNPQAGIAIRQRDQIITLLKDIKTLLGVISDGKET